MKWFQGRHTMFALYFTVMGTILAWCRRLDPNFIALIGAIQGLIFIHSAKEDYFNMKAAQQPTSTPAPDSQGGDSASAQ
jgi:hypothetical protein